MTLDETVTISRHIRLSSSFISMTEIPMDRLKARAGTPRRTKVLAEPSERRFEPACNAQQDADRPRDLATENGVPNPAATWKKKGLHTAVRTALDPVVAAKLAKLRHVRDDTPGITRHQARRGFDCDLPKMLYPPSNLRRLLRWNVAINLEGPDAQLSGCKRGRDERRRGGGCRVPQLTPRRTRTGAETSGRRRRF